MERVNIILQNKEIIFPNNTIATKYNKVEINKNLLLWEVMWYMEWFNWLWV